VEVLGTLPNASNATMLARDGNGNLVVYKPSFGAQPLHDFDSSTLAAREVLTYEVSEALGFGIIPETRLVDGLYGPGSVQKMIHEDRDTDPRSMLEGPDEKLWPFAILDIVTNNTDRKLGHLLLESGSNRIWGIDNGLTFHCLPKLRTVLWGFADRELPQAMVSALGLLDAALSGGLHERIANLLSEPEAAAVRHRVSALRRNPIHPPPPTNRQPLPWPWW
jgi:hypothetical protein